MPIHSSRRRRGLALMAGAAALAAAACQTKTTFTISCPAWAVPVTVKATTTPDAVKAGATTKVHFSVPGNLSISEGGIITSSATFARPSLLATVDRVTTSDGTPSEFTADEHSISVKSNIRDIVITGTVSPTATPGQELAWTAPTYRSTFYYGYSPSLIPGPTEPTDPTGPTTTSTTTTTMPRQISAFVCTPQPSDKPPVLIKQGIVL